MAWRFISRPIFRCALAALWLATAVHQAHAAAAEPPCPPPLAAASPQAGAERDRGLLWRISRDGRSSWLFGTLHVGKPAWRQAGPRVAAALRASDVLALEIDPSDPALLAALAAIEPPAHLPEALAARLLQAYRRACVAPEAMATLHPLLQATTLIVLEARWLGMDVDFAQEQLLLTRAKRQRKRVVSLETAAQQTAALVPADGAAALAALEQSLAQLEDRSGRRVVARMAQAWEDGDLAALEDWAGWCECAAGSEGDRAEDDMALMRRLNEERNGPLADGIEAQHRRGLRVFAAVGALHMTGLKALPKLLQQRGFKVERVGFAR